MFPVVRFLSATLVLLWAAPAAFGQNNIEFDVPAIVSASEISSSSLPHEKLVRITLPISTATNSKYRGNIDEFRFDISWNRNVCLIDDFGPKTQTTSKIDGLKTVEQNSTHNSGLSFNFKARPFELATANLLSDIGDSKARRETWQEIPPHEILVASGTIERGTGAFFRFHPSSSTPLEGSRDLKLTYRVPADWKSGILNVECRARGSLPVVGLWKEPVEFGRSFVVPVYLQQNTSAQKLAIDFAKAEQDLRKAWSGFKSNISQPHPLRFASTGVNRLPEQWPHLLIQSGDDQYLSQFAGYLTEEVNQAASAFVQARKSLSLHQ